MLKSGRWKEAVQAYLAAIAYCDAQIGRLLDAFDKSPHKDNTIIVFWGDHGWHLGEKEHWRKFALWEEATRMPFIWVAPGVTKPGGVCDRTVDLMSVYPTLCSLCGIATPKHVEGEDIKPLLRDPKAKWDRPGDHDVPPEQPRRPHRAVALHPLRRRRRGTVRPRRGRVRVDEPGEGREVRRGEGGADEAAPGGEQARVAAREEARSECYPNGGHRMLTRSRKAVRFAAVGSAPPCSPPSAAGRTGQDHPVNGKVVYKGRGTWPSWRAARSTSSRCANRRSRPAGRSADGAFTVWCYLEGKDREGVPAGEYRVCVRPPTGGDEPRRGARSTPATSASRRRN